MNEHKAASLRVDGNSFNFWSSLDDNWVEMEESIESIVQLVVVFNS